MQSTAPPLLFSKLFPLPTTKAGFGKRGLCVLDVDAACFEMGGGAGPEGECAPTTVHYIDETQNRTDDCFVSFSANCSQSAAGRAENSGKQQHNKAAVVHYMRPSTLQWNETRSMTSRCFALGTIDPLRGEEYQRHLDLLTTQTPAAAVATASPTTTAAYTGNKSSTPPATASSGGNSGAAHTHAKTKAAVVRQWLCPFGRRIAVQVECSVPRGYFDDGNSNTNNNNSSSAAVDICSYILFYDSFLIHQHGDGAVPSSSSSSTTTAPAPQVMSPASSPLSSPSPASQGRGWFLSALLRLPSQAYHSVGCSSGSFIGGFLTSGVFLFGWHGHCINCQFLDSGVQAKIFRCSLEPAAFPAVFEALVTGAPTGEHDDDQTATQEQPHHHQQQRRSEEPPSLNSFAAVTTCPWYVSASSCSDYDASQLFFIIIAGYKFIVTSSTQKNDLTSFGSNNNSSSNSVNPAVLLHFRVRFMSTSGTSAFLRHVPFRHGALTESFIESSLPSSMSTSFWSSSPAPSSSSANNLHNNNNSSNNMSTLGTSTVVVSTTSGALNNNSSSSNINSNASSNLLSNFKNKQYTNSQLKLSAVPTGKRLVRVFSSCCYGMLPIGSGGGGGLLSTSNLLQGSWTVVWESVPPESAKIHLFHAKKSFFVSRDNLYKQAQAQQTDGKPGSSQAAGGAPPAGGSTSGGSAAGGSGSTGDCLVDLLRNGPECVLNVALVDEQRIRVCYFADCKLQIIEIHFSVSGFFARKEQPPQSLFSVALPSSFSGAIVDVNNGSAASIGIISDGQSLMVSQLSEK